MPELPPTERTLAARLAAHASWANTEDPAARTAPARQAMRAKFLELAGGDVRRADHLRKAHYARLALRSAQARRKARDARKAAASAQAAAQAEADAAAAVVDDAQLPGQLAIDDAAD